jgi:hypothetical protein
MPSPIRSIPLLLAPLWASLAGCLTTETHASPVAPAAAVSATPDRAWEIVNPAGEALGYVVRFEENAPRTATPRAFYSIRNPYQQELGLVDDLGRSWRFEPHAKEPAWLGSGSVAEGTGRILGTTVELVETTLAQLAPPSPPKN